MEDQPTIDAKEKLAEFVSGFIGFCETTMEDDIRECTRIVVTMFPKMRREIVDPMVCEIVEKAWWHKSYRDAVRRSVA